MIKEEWKAVDYSRLIAHRGLNGHEKENTMAAFIAAANRDFYGIETDIHVTADGKYVVCHNDSTDVMAKKAFNVEENTMDFLSTVKVTDIDGEYRSDLYLAKYEEYLKICVRYGKVPVVELKNKMQTGNIAEIVRIAREKTDINNVIFISFNFENMLCLRKLLPDGKLMWLSSVYNEETLKKLKDNNLDLDVKYDAVTEEDIKTLHENGIKVNVWTVRDAETCRKYLEYGADLITVELR